MKSFIGIDLGTTNSAICSYDGFETRVWKSPEQNDVTPSVIFIDRRGNRYVGKRAYDSAPTSPNNSAMLFKRLMGTSTPINFSAINVTKTPEECSAEILKILFGYLPEEVRNNPEVGTVITVPAAFNQMQKDATMQAAKMAGIGNVALMQEPVAAVMSVVRTKKADGMFLIFDLGGGTLDIAIAESVNGKVTLLSHGGIAMCGGRDFDRLLVDNVVKPWLLENFELPENFSVNSNYKSLLRLATWATERAKIELSSCESSVISLAENELRLQDLSGNEIYIDIPLERATYDNLISEKIEESIEAARETLKKVGVESHDLEYIVFVGGPTNYKPLRDKVSFELGVKADISVNPMTAVAEGACLFAESIDWKSQNRKRKSNKGKIGTEGSIPLTFSYISRTSENKAKVALQVKTKVAPGCEFQIDSLDTGWTSGRITLKNGTILDLSLAVHGENTFKVFVFDEVGHPITLDEDRIIITRTTATIEAIPASHSIGIEVLEKMGGTPTLDYLVHSGDSLPVKGKKIFKATESLKAGAFGSINLKLWEGEIEDPITDNRPIGMLKISGADFDDGVIPAGAELECEFEVLDSGNVIIEVSVPCIGSVFNSGKNFYSRQDGQIDYTEASAIISEESNRIEQRIDEIKEAIDNPKLEQARRKLDSARNLSSTKETENTQEAMEKIFEVKKILAEVRKDNLKEIRQIDLNRAIDFFNDFIREFAKQSELITFDNLAKTAQRSIDRNDKDFEYHFSELQTKSAEILWRQDWFILEKFKWAIQTPHNFTDKEQYKELCRLGANFLQDGELEKLRTIVIQLTLIQLTGSSDSELLEHANIVRG